MYIDSFFFQKCRAQTHSRLNPRFRKLAAGPKFHVLQFYFVFFFSFFPFRFEILQLKAHNRDMYEDLLVKSICKKQEKISHDLSFRTCEMVEFLFNNSFLRLTNLFIILAKLLHINNRHRASAWEFNGSIMTSD